MKFGRSFPKKIDNHFGTFWYFIHEYHYYRITPGIE